MWSNIANFFGRPLGMARSTNTRGCIAWVCNQKPSQRDKQYSLGPTIFPNSFPTGGSSRANIVDEKLIEATFIQRHSKGLDRWRKESKTRWRRATTMVWKNNTALSTMHSSERWKGSFQTFKCFLGCIWLQDSQRLLEQGCFERMWLGLHYMCSNTELVSTATCQSQAKQIDYMR